MISLTNFQKTYLPLSFCLIGTLLLRSLSLIFKKCFSELLTHSHIAAEFFVSDLLDVLLFELLSHWHIVAEIFVSDLQGVLLCELEIHSLWISSFLHIFSSVLTLFIYLPETLDICTLFFLVIKATLLLLLTFCSGTRHLVRP